MTHDEILNLAQIVKLTDEDLGLGMTDYGQSELEIIIFAKLIAASERERCANVCDGLATAASCARVIRSLE